MADDTKKNGFTAFIENRLMDVLEDMNVPSMRKDISSIHNVKWLMRNISIQNGSNPELSEALSLLKQAHRNLAKSG
jgi:hypothetical protein